MREHRGAGGRDASMCEWPRSSPVPVFTHHDVELGYARSAAPSSRGQKPMTSSCLYGGKSKGQPSARVLLSLLRAPCADGRASRPVLGRLVSSPKTEVR